MVTGNGDIRKANSIPNMPLRAPLADENGFISTQWAAFLREIYNRVAVFTDPKVGHVGTSSGLSSADLQSSVAAIQASLALSNSGLDSLGQGRTL